MGLAALKADITTLAVDAIVNAANERLARGGGVCGAIFAAAGPGLQAACDALAPCPTGGAVITPGFALKAKWIVHAVGPVWYGGDQGEDDKLASAYRESFSRARERSCRSIAFPAISTGIYGYPLKRATAIAVRIARDEAGEIDVIFACFDDTTLAAYLAEGVPPDPMSK
jgi:O-acetyl-ADP-ribose deacetylase (regulator of RNase III)